ncbi:MBL fold metallo-hydrolase [Planococcus salinus]|uniref:MBL fold metallo-hydrolase n=2 Tax=Planococcus salinus TaxID=1848460 RepID=A0A3M8PBY1_9BACL|nr:MBL fold metallo-hydrolase [Planococcus salinus]
MITEYEKEGVICAEGYLEATKRKIFVYLVDGMLVDTGPKRMEPDFTSFYDKHSFDKVVLTHSHEDHSGTASWIQTNRDVPIYMHENGIALCAKPGNYPEYRQHSWGVRDAFDALPLRDTIRSRNLTWDVIYTPGHADDHVALLHKETGRVFTGDLFVQTKTKISMNTESIPQIMESIRTLLSYDISSMYCSHSGYFENGRETLQKKLDYLEELSATVERLYREGKSPEAIANQLFPKNYPIIARSEREWHPIHLINSILAPVKI